LFQHGVVALFGFGRRDVADGLQEPSIVEPVDPFQGRELDGLEAAPWPAQMDYLGLVETVDGFGESVVIGISDAADRRFDAGFSQTFSVFYRDVLRGFKRSSQHSEIGDCDEHSKAKIGTIWTSAIAIAGAAAGGGA